MIGWGKEGEGRGQESVYVRILYFKCEYNLAVRLPYRSSSRSRSLQPRSRVRAAPGVPWPLLAATRQQEEATGGGGGRLVQGGPGEHHLGEGGYMWAGSL